MTSNTLADKLEKLCSARANDTRIPREERNDNLAQFVFAHIGEISAALRGQDQAVAACSLGAALLLRNAKNGRL